MLKPTVAVLAVALAGTASAGWRSLRIDGSSEAGFNESVAAMQAKLPEVRRHLFDWALRDIWVHGTQRAEAEQREYTASEYFRELDGLGYKDVVTFTDPTGVTAGNRYNQVHAQLRPHPWRGATGSPGAYTYTQPDRPANDGPQGGVLTEREVELRSPR